MMLPSDDEPWLTLREIDQQAGQPKGSAFRAFKRLESDMTENRDYQLLSSDRDAARIEALRAASRVYRSSRNVLLLSAETARRLLDSFR